MKWKVGCDLNITEDRTMIAQVRIKWRWSPCARHEGIWGDGGI